MKSNLFNRNLAFTIALIFLVILSACVNDDNPVNKGVGVGDELPQFTVQLNNGETISTTSLRGKVVVIEFFNTGCNDCQQGLPAINRLYEEYKEDSGISIFAISREENSGSIERYWKENNFSLPYSPQSDRAVYNLFATTVIPRTYIADKNGKIVATFGDSDIPSLSELRLAIESIRY